MAFCGKCGGEVAAGAAFCPKCGAPQTAAAAPQVAGPMTPAEAGMSENVAGLLCYLVGWITGIIFFLIDKRPFVRFHAAQSMVVFGGLFAIRIVLGAAFGAGYMVMGFGSYGMLGALYTLIGLLGLILWVLLMVKAYQHEMFEVPIAAGIAKSFAGK
jgi:uncharacterized membrane protein